MAGIALATKYQSKTSDLMKARAKSEPFTNQDWDWDGVNSIVVYTLTDPTMGDYNPNGSNRYGNPTEVEDTTQTWTLSRDRAWTKTIDKINMQDTAGVRKAGKYLAQATKNVLVPERDTFVFQAIATAASASGVDRDDIVADAATSSSNAWTNFTAINADITDKEAPEEGRVAAMTPAYYNLLKQSGYVLASNSAYADRKSGDMGEFVDGVRVVIVPSSRMPTTTGAIDLLISHPSVCAGPNKLTDYTLHNNPPGISGDLLEYRIRYDAICDSNRLNAVGMHAVA